MQQNFEAKIESVTDLNTLGHTQQENARATFFSPGKVNSSSCVFIKVRFLKYLKFIGKPYFSISRNYYIDFNAIDTHFFFVGGMLMKWQMFLELGSCVFYQGQSSKISQILVKTYLLWIWI